MGDWALSVATRGYLCQITQPNGVVQQYPLPPDEAQSLFAKALELPLPESLTATDGIFQGDVIIRGAIVRAIADLRSKPGLLRHVFGSLPKDPVTCREYGEQEIDRAKEWFKKTKINVLMDYRVDQNTSFPCITISMLSSTEAEQTLGDIHYQPFIDIDSEWPDMTEKFSPVLYSEGTGIMEIPETIANQVVISDGMMVIDRHGNAHEILEVIDDVSFMIKAGTIADFNDASIRGARPAYTMALESMRYFEKYSIGCHAIGDPIILTYLHSVVVFCLLAYKQVLLEARGFERTAVNSSGFQMNDTLTPENVFSRYIELSGYVQQVWPKGIHPRVTSVSVDTIGLVGVQNSTHVDPTSPDNTEPFYGIEDIDSIG